MANENDIWDKLCEVSTALGRIEANQAAVANDLKDHVAADDIRLNTMAAGIASLQATRAAAVTTSNVWGGIRKHSFSALAIAISLFTAWKTH